MTTFQTIARNITLEATSAGALDGRGFIDGWSFTHTITGTFPVMNSPPNQPLAYGGVATLSSVLIAVPAVVSVGGNGPQDIPFFAAGPASGTTVTVILTSPSISSGQIIQSTWTKV